MFFFEINSQNKSQQIKKKLKELAKLTPAEHQDHANVNTSVNSIQELVNYVNEKKRTFEGVDGLMKAIESVTNLPKVRKKKKSDFSIKKNTKNNLKKGFCCLDSI